ncbi:MAG: hypothetical protein J6Y72_05435 [Bacteroidales bacterium]|jgi:acetolactate synthase regulatory subunit|nr:hypothetical protein [Bacteroidales bacterium]MBP5419234.1 hypothetical protein [Bacteroidales bacterium]MCR5695768.1 hypothetical protein [Marinilabiliaceae bacterium]
MQQQVIIDEAETTVVNIHLNSADFQLTRIVNVLEDNGARIKNINVVTHSDVDTDITIYLSVESAEAISQALDRYGYEASVVAPASSPDNPSTIKRNYDALMNFLNV